MYRNLIIGVDAERGGADAAALAAALAAPDASIALVYVSGLPLGVRASTRDLDIADEAGLRKLLARELSLCGGEAEVLRVVASTVGAGLDDAAEQRGADLVVVGASRHRGLARLVSGDDVRGTMHRTACAVAVAPRDYAHRRAALRRVGVCCDDTPASEVAVAHAGLLAAERRRELVARHVASPHYFAPGFAMAPLPVDLPESVVAAAQSALADVEGVPVEHVYGVTCERLVEFADSVDLIVCGSRHQRPLRRLAEGSTSDYLARHAHRPLLVTPAVDPATVNRWRAQRATAA